MELPAPLLKLPLRFDHERMLDEISRFQRHEWRPERFDVDGYWAMNLVSFKGWDNDRQEAPMQVTERLRRCPYIQQVIGSFQSVLAEVRLRWLERAGEVLEHYDNHYLFFRRVRIHLPVTTNPGAIFWCDGEKVQMRAGEVWAFDRLRPHKVTNSKDSGRIHITLDTVGSPYLWGLIGDAVRPREARRRGGKDVAEIRFNPRARPRLVTEQIPVSPVLNPAEVEYFIVDLLRRWAEWPRTNQKQLASVRQLLVDFHRKWWSVWLEGGAAQSAWPTYRKISEELFAEVIRVKGVLDSSICSPVFRLASFLGTGAFNPQLGSFLRSMDRFDPLDAPMELAQEVVFRLQPFGDLSVGLSSDMEFRKCEPFECAILQGIAGGGSARVAAETVGPTISPGELVQVIRKLLDEEILVSAPEEPPMNFESLLPKSRPAKKASDKRRSVADSENTSVPTLGLSSDPMRMKMRLKRDVFFRMSVNGSLGLWVPKIFRYQKVGAHLVSVLCAVARGQTFGEALRNAGLSTDQASESLAGILLRLDLVEIP